VSDFLASATAEYLDPFIDGEVPSSEYSMRSEGSFMQRLHKAWSARQSLAVVTAVGAEMPVPPKCALAQYMVHCISKMNTNLGFSHHTPGAGRFPCSTSGAESHFQMLGKTLAEAVERDFEPEERNLGTSPLTSAQIAAIARKHWNGLVTHQTELGNALGTANRDGEEARREERIRIWGYA
jgi:hypothetical protein